MALGRGSLIGGLYTLVEPLDRGGMGTVWEGKDAAGQPVAVKLISNSFANDRALRRFKREVRALEQLNHPNVVRILGHGLESDVPFIAMELLDGESLRHLFARRGTFPPHEAANLLRQAGLGLAAGHASGIVHRDIKPSNLFCCSDERAALSVKVIDFGIAIGDALEGNTEASKTAMVGSPAYMSPELARGERFDQSIDVWALAVVAFQMLTGREPFMGANVPETLQRVCSGQVPRASDAATGLPRDADAFFARAFCPRLGDRYRDVTALVDAFEAMCVAGQNVAATSLPGRASQGRANTTSPLSTSALPTPAKATPQRASARAISASALVLAIAGGAWLAARGLERAPATAELKPSTPSAAQGVAMPATANVASRDTAVAATPSAPSAGAGQVAAAPHHAPAARLTAKASAQPPSGPAPSSAPAPAAGPSPVAAELDPVFGLRVAPPDAPPLPASVDAARDDSRGSGARSLR